MIGSASRARRTSFTGVVARDARPAAACGRCPPDLAERCELGVVGERLVARRVDVAVDRDDARAERVLGLERRPAGDTGTRGAADHEADERAVARKAEGIRARPVDRNSGVGGSRNLREGAHRAVRQAALDVDAEFVIEQPQDDADLRPPLARLERELQIAVTVVGDCDEHGGAIDARLLERALLVGDRDDVARPAGLDAFLVARRAVPERGDAVPAVRRKLLADA